MLTEIITNGVALHKTYASFQRHKYLQCISR